MNERIKQLRKALNNMSQEKFGKHLGVGKSAVSRMELGKYNVTESMIKLICTEFNVDYMWLTTGHGEMFSSIESNYIGLIDRVMAGENEFARDVFKTFAKFKEDDWLALERMIDLYNETKKEPTE